VPLVNTTRSNPEQRRGRILSCGRSTIAPLAGAGALSRETVASLIVKIINAPDYASRGNLGVNKPNTEGGKPRFA
jgi:hypothetical protein